MPIKKGILWWGFHNYGIDSIGTGWSKSRCHKKPVSHLDRLSENTSFLKFTHNYTCPHEDGEGATRLQR